MARYPYEPNYTVVPGEIVSEHMEFLGMNQAELARRSGRSAKLINKIVNGKAPMEPETALQFEKEGVYIPDYAVGVPGTILHTCATMVS